MAQVSGAREYGVHVPSTKKLKIGGESGAARAASARATLQNQQLRRKAAIRTCRTTRARLFLTLRTELPLGERVSLYQMKFLGREDKLEPVGVTRSAVW